MGNASPTPSLGWAARVAAIVAVLFLKVALVPVRTATSVTPKHIHCTRGCGGLRKGTTHSKNLYKSDRGHVGLFDLFSFISSLCVGSKDLGYSPLGYLCEVQYPPSPPQKRRSASAVYSSPPPLNTHAVAVSAAHHPKEKKQTFPCPSDLAYCFLYYHPLIYLYYIHLYCSIS